MVACVLALLVVAPTMSASLCLCDSGAPTRAATAQVTPGDTHRDAPPCDAACCLSGHCHHGGSMLDPLVPSIPAPVPVVAEHLPSATRTLASRTTAGPERPPRA